MRRRSTKDLEEARQDLEAARTRVDTEIRALQEQGEHVAGLVKSKSQDVNVLLHYKVCVCVCCAYADVCICVLVHSCTCIYVHVYVCMYVCVFMVCVNSGRKKSTL